VGLHGVLHRGGGPITCRILGEVENCSGRTWVRNIEQRGGLINGALMFRPRLAGRP